MQTTLPRNRFPLVCDRPHPLRARFIDRPGRFTARVRLASGRRALAHLPNPGRMTGVIVRDCPVLLDGPSRKGRVHPYTMVAARPGRTWIGTNTAYVNRIFPALWGLGVFPEFAGHPLQAEVRLGPSRFDFQVGSTLIELKSVTLAEDRLGLFPDAQTSRGTRHCRELAALAGRAVPTAIVFMAQRGDLDAIAPAPTIDPDFAAALRRAVSAGVKLLGCALTLGPDGARAARRVPVIL